MSLLLDALKKAEEAKRKKLEAERGEATAGAVTSDASAGTAVPTATPERVAANPAVEFPSLSFAEEHPPAAPEVPAVEMPTAAVAAQPSTLSLTPLAETAVESAPAGESEAAAPPGAQADDAAAAAALQADEPDTSAAVTAPTTTPAAESEQVPRPALSFEVPPAAPAVSASVAAARLSGRSGKAASSPAAGQAAPAPVAEPAPPAVKTASERRTESTGTAETISATRSEAPLKLSAEATRQLFDSKTKPRTPMTRQQRTLILASFILLAFIAAAGWLWWKAGGASGLLLASQSGITPVGQAPAANPAPSAMAPAATGAPAAANAPAPAVNSATSPVANGAASTAGKSDGGGAIHVASGDGSAKAMAPDAALPVRPRPGDRARVVEVPANLASNAVHFVRSEAQPSVPATVEQGYEAYQRGDLAGAMKSYQAQLAVDPNNHDALLGMAAVALKQHHSNEARAYYEKLLSIEPHDPTALSAMAVLSADGSTASSEAALRHAYEAQPTAEAATSLGTLLARQQRWREAQDYYFKAYTAASDEPDYAFNLAVSLDALGQRALAAQYYDRALTLGATHAASFDRDAAHRRLMELRAP